jgi:predicted nucleic-acid-binding protein
VLRLVAGVSLTVEVARVAFVCSAFEHLVVLVVHDGARRATIVAVVETNIRTTKFNVARTPWIATIQTHG